MLIAEATDATNENIAMSSGAQKLSMQDIIDLKSQGLDGKVRLIQFVRGLN